MFKVTQTGKQNKVVISLLLSLKEKKYMFVEITKSKYGKCVFNEYNKFSMFLSSLKKEL